MLAISGDLDWTVPSQQVLFLLSLSRGRRNFRTKEEQCWIAALHHETSTCHVCANTPHVIAQKERIIGGVAEVSQCREEAACGGDSVEDAEREGRSTTPRRRGRRCSHWSTRQHHLLISLAASKYHERTASSRNMWMLNRVF
jgi:hypothetical protein